MGLIFFIYNKSLTFIANKHKVKNYKHEKNCIYLSLCFVLF